MSLHYTKGGQRVLPAPAILSNLVLFLANDGCGCEWLTTFKNHGNWPYRLGKNCVEFLWDEGMFVISDIISGHAAPVAMIGVAEKGAVNFKMTVVYLIVYPC